MDNIEKNIGTVPTVSKYRASHWYQRTQRTRRPKQCRYSIRLRFRSSSLIPAYGKRVREEAVWNYQLRLRIYKGPTRRDWDLARRSDLVDPPARFMLCVCVCQSRRCVSSTLEPSGSRLSRSVPMKSLTASGSSQSPHLIGIPDNSRWKECSILRAVVYDPDKLAFAAFRREKRPGAAASSAAAADSARRAARAASFRLVSPPRIFTSS